MKKDTKTKAEGLKKEDKKDPKIKIWELPNGTKVRQKIG